MSLCVVVARNNYYIKASWFIVRYESTVRGMFYGHNHKDHWQVMYDPATNYTRPMATVFIPGAGQSALVSLSSGGTLTFEQENHEGITFQPSLPAHSGSSGMPYKESSM